jgi:hypothetical protein
LLWTLKITYFEWKLIQIENPKNLTAQRPEKPPEVTVFSSRGEDGDHVRSAFAQTPQNCKFIWQDVDESADYFDPKFFGQTKECLGTLLENIGRRLSESIICGEVGASDVAMHQTYHFGSTLW